MNTKQRALVLDTVCSNCDHMTAEDIYILAKAKMPQIAMGTVYRNLNQLVGDGLVRKISVPDGPDRYDGCTSSHEHMFCDKCKRVVDIWCGDISEKLSLLTGCSITSYSLDLHGICEMCKEKE